MQAVLASSHLSMIVRDGDQLFHRQFGRPDREITGFPDPDVFIRAAKAKWNMLEVVGADGKESPEITSEFPTLSPATIKGVAVYQISGI